jgi:hypothetical protein
MDFSSSLCVQTGSGAHPASCTMGTGGTFPWGKAWPGRDAYHSPLSSAEVENEWELYLSTQAPSWLVAELLNFSGVMVSVLAAGRKGRGFQPGRCDGILRTKEVHITSSF